MASNRGHRRSASTPTGSAELSALLGSAAHRRAQRYTVRTSLVNVIEEPAREELAAIGLGIEMQPPRPSRVTLQAALDNLRLDKPVAPPLSPAMKPLSPLAPTFKPTSSSTNFKAYTHRRTTSGGSVASHAAGLVPSLEQIRAWKETRDAARGTLEDEWPSTVATAEATPDLVIEDEAPSSPDEPKENRRPPSPTLTFTNFDRKDARRQLTILNRRSAGSLSQ